MAFLVLGRLVFLLCNPMVLFGDGLAYVQAAQTIVDTGKLPPLFVQPRGFPLLIAPLLMASGPEIARTVIVMNSVMDSAVVAILLYSARSILSRPENRTLLRWCWLLAAFQPFTAQMVNSVYTETSTMFLVFVGVCLLFASHSFVTMAFGLGLLGLASLLRIDVLILNFLIVTIYLTFFRHEKFSPKVALFGFFLFCMFPFLMLTYQYYSTREIGLVRPDLVWNPGYYTWMRSWFAIEKTEYDRFHFDIGTKDWAGFDIANYPARAFGSDAERGRVSDLLATWRSEGYSEPVDRGFRELGIERFKENPMRSLVFVPLLRMAHFWINIEDAQSYLRVISLHRPISTLIVAFTFLFRLVLLFLAAVGTYAIWLRPPAPLTDQILFLRFASLFALLRTAELGALGIFAWGGLMEVRFIIVAVPFVILLSFWGIRHLFGIPSQGSPTSNEGFEVAHL